MPTRWIIAAAVIVTLALFAVFGTGLSAILNMK